MCVNLCRSCACAVPPRTGDEDHGRLHCGGVQPAASGKVNIELRPPRPAVHADPAAVRPTTAATIASPSPVLPAARERELSPRAKRSKTSGQDVRRDARAVVGHVQPDHSVRSGPCGRHRGARRGVRTGVGQQVDQHLVQLARIAEDADGLAGDVQLPPVVRARDVRVADGVDHQPGQVDPLARQRPAGVEPGQQQQVLDQRGHPARLGLDAAHRVRDVRRHLLAAAAGQLGVTADRGERRAQLVAGVGDELADAGLARLPRGERVARRAEHPVQRRSRPCRPRCSGRCRRPEPVPTARLRRGPAAARRRGVAVAATRSSGRSVRRIIAAPTAPRDQRSRRARHRRAMN